MLRSTLKPMRQIGKKLWRSVRPASLILLYHRVADLESDPQLLTVSPTNFAEHLAFLRQHYSPCPLKNLEPNTPTAHRQIVITFDDGYGDNLHQAKPLLERYSIPATVFVTAGTIGQIEEFWWDELERLLLYPGQLPSRLEVTIAQQTHHWDLGAAAYSPLERERDRLWTVLDPADPTPRHRVYRELCGLLRPLTADDRHSVLTALQAQAGVDSVGRISHRTLTESEVVDLAQDGLVEVGAHAMTHSVLSQQSSLLQEKEIRSSKAHLEALLGHPVTSFAYPFGTLGDYTAETVKIVRQCGFERACSNYEGAIRHWLDPFQMPRFIVRNWNGDEFAKRLREWWNA
ncbi:MAG: polysaccharide deacetylase family protein [Leptolyngbyaceae cyanobacterium bins.59]|nr:polysaccharide deacetylase family protein [Leptolyngbyaceae cyanobacterium bins.59]